MVATTMATAIVAVENADANGEHTELGLRGDESVVSARRAEGTANMRARAAVQAALDKIRPVQPSVPVPREVLQRRSLHKTRRGSLSMPRFVHGLLASTSHRVSWHHYHFRPMFRP